MGGECREKRDVLFVLQAGFPAFAPDKSCNLGIVNVADPREQVVLDLEIQAPKQPAQQPASPRKIHRRLDLVN